MMRSIMSSSALFWITLLLQSVAIFVNGAANDKAQSTPMDAKALVQGRISCYVCNSDNAEQQNCTSSDVEQLKDFVTVCPPLTEGPLAGTEAKSCRKVLQNFGIESNVVRECAYTGTEPVDGKRRTGNKGITLYIYQCFNGQNDKPCNSAIMRREGGAFSIQILMAIASLFVLFFV